MQPKSLNCPMCGAAVRNDATKCEHCGARLATIACPRCFGMVFTGTKFCPHCGAEPNRQESVEHLGACPRCRAPMRRVEIGAAPVGECAKCEGLWVDKATLERLCAERESETPVLGRASQVPGAAPEAPNQIRYVPCPRCNVLMNRINFANCSGVIVDVCRDHGTWFDRDELRRVFEFVRSGGMDLARERKKAELQEEERRVRQLARSRLSDVADKDDVRLTAIRATRDLLYRYLR